MTRRKQLMAAIGFLVSFAASIVLMAMPSSAVTIPAPPGAEVGCQASTSGASCYFSVK